jgi:hypothetical protein
MFHEKFVFSKMILTHESGSQEDQFYEKKWRQKILWYYPFKELARIFGNSMKTIFAFPI